MSKTDDILYRRIYESKPLQPNVIIVSRVEQLGLFVFHQMDTEYYKENIEWIPKDRDSLGVIINSLANLGFRLTHVIQGTKHNTDETFVFYPME